jgi:hypothetical protein
MMLLYWACVLLLLLWSPQQLCAMDTVEVTGRYRDTGRSLVIRYFASIATKVVDQSAGELINAVQIYAVANGITETVDISAKMITAVMGDLADDEQAPVFTNRVGSKKKVFFTIAPRVDEVGAFIRGLLASHKIIVDKRTYSSGQAAKQQLKVKTFTSS